MMKAQHNLYNRKENNVKAISEYSNNVLIIQQKYAQWYHINLTQTQDTLAIYQTRTLGPNHVAAISLQQILLFGVQNVM